MKVIRVFKSMMGLNLMRDKQQVSKNNVIHYEYMNYKENKVKDIKDMGYFYNSQRKAIKKQYKAKKVMALSNGNYEKCLYTLKNGLLSVWRLNPNDPKSTSQTLKHGKKSLKHYFKWNNKKLGVI